MKLFDAEMSNKTEWRRRSIMGASFLTSKPVPGATCLVTGQINEIDNDKENTRAPGHDAPCWHCRSPEEGKKDGTQMRNNGKGAWSSIDRAKAEKGPHHSEALSCLILFL
jgi:hypothetical protein